MNIRKPKLLKWTKQVRGKSFRCVRLWVIHRSKHEKILYQENHSTFSNPLNLIKQRWKTKEPITSWTCPKPQVCLRMSMNLCPFKPWLYWSMFKGIEPHRTVKSYINKRCPPVVLWTHPHKTTPSLLVFGDVQLSPAGSPIDCQPDISVGWKVSYSSELQTDWSWRRSLWGGKMSLSTGALTPGSETITEGEIICVGECVSMYCGRKPSVQEFCFYWTNLHLMIFVFFYVNIQCWYRKSWGLSCTP